MEQLTHQVLTVDRVQIPFDLYQESGRNAVLIICPGFFKSKDTPTFRRMSQALAASSDVIAMDFRGHGRSGGWYTFSAREGADLDAVLEWARERYAHLAVMGFSLGGAIAINTVSRHPGWVQSVVAVSAPSAFEQVEFKWWTPEAMRTGVVGLERGSGCRPGNPLLKKAKPIEHVQQLAPTPTLFMHGTRDVIVGVDHSRRLYAAALEPKRLEIIEGGSHAEALFRDDPNRFLRLVDSWLAQTLPLRAPG